MAANTAIHISKSAQQGIIEYHRQSYSMINSQWNIRDQMRFVDLACAREQDWTAENWKARISNALGDATKFQNVTVPVVMPQVRSAVVYQCSVFLQGNPIFGCVADPMFEDQALQIQAIIEENSIRGGWVQQFLIFFTDLFKYNIGFIETTWDRQVTAAIETDIGFSTSQGRPKEMIWQGNKVKRWDPYNSFWDIRVKPTELHTKGEFAGTTELMSRIALKKFIAELPDKMVANIIPAFESGLGWSGLNGSGGIESYYIPQINPNAILPAESYNTFDWMAWAGVTERKPENNINYRNIYEVTTLYARILPSDFGIRVASENTPQVWKFIIVNHQVLIYAERQTNAHNLLPVVCGQAIEDGLGYQTKSLAINAIPYQQIASALVNSTMAARRRSISDRGLYDPSRVSEAHINSDNPAAKIPVRPAAYGKPLSDAYYPIPFRDEQSALAFQELGQVLGFANLASGQNQTRQGQFVKGNKTQSEFDSTMANANGPDQCTSLLLESQVFTPIKEIIKANTLQFQAGTTIYSPSQERNVVVDPLTLRQAIWAFKVTDGLTPSDKLISFDSMQAAFQTISNVPPLQAGYNLPPMFSYMMKTQNANLKPFEKTPEQIAYEAAMGQWQEMVQYAVDAAIKAGQDITNAKWPAQPLPEQYGYKPTGLNPAQPGTTAALPTAQATSPQGV